MSGSPWQQLQERQVRRHELQELQIGTQELDTLLQVVINVIGDPGVVASQNATIVFRNLLTIKRWLRREWDAHGISRLPRPSELVLPTYRLHEFELLRSARVIPAEIVGLDERPSSMAAFAKFPGCAELPGVNAFVVGFEDDDRLLEVVQFQRVESSTGEDLPAPQGALLGLFDALLATCRCELDRLRIIVAHWEDIVLPRADGGPSGLDALQAAEGKNPASLD